MRKKKYIIAALSAGMCLSVIPGSTVSAEKQQADSGISPVVNNASDAVNVVSQISGLYGKSELCSQSSQKRR